MDPVISKRCKISLKRILKIFKGTFISCVSFLPIFEVPVLISLLKSDKITSDRLSLDYDFKLMTLYPDKYYGICVRNNNTLLIPEIEKHE